MYYDEKFLASLPDDYASAIVAIGDEFMVAKKLCSDVDKKFEVIRDTHALLSVYFQKQGFPISHLLSGILPEEAKRLPDLTGNKENDIERIHRYVVTLMNAAIKHLNLDGYVQAQRQYSLMLGATAFHYEFSEGDLARIQELVNELRDLIAASDELEERHRRRVLGRLERLQSELHKKVSDLSWFWGELIEASIAAKIIGENAKPIVDRIREIVGIVWPVEARAFDLPSDTPFKLPGQTDGKLNATSRPTLPDKD